VREVISRYGRSIDDRDWAGSGSILADTVELDFTSLRGGQLETLTRTELVGRWRDMSERLDATQHLIAGILATIDGESATAVASVVAVYRRANATGGSLWTVGGTYRFTLRHVAQHWLIGDLSLLVAWVDGNQAVVGADA
jgi:hypothetical protein